VLTDRSEPSAGRELDSSIAPAGAISVVGRAGNAGRCPKAIAIAAKQTSATVAVLTRIVRCDCSARPSNPFGIPPIKEQRPQK
jgi:hypothetical protein